MRIATLSNAAVGHTRRWVEWFRSRGHTVRVWSLEAPLEGFDADRLPVAPLPGALRYPLAAPALRAALARFAPDVVDAHYVPNYGMLGVLAGRHPLSVTAWGSDLLITGARDALQRARARFVLSRAELVIADAENLAAAARALGAAAARTHAIPWGIDLTRFHAAPERVPGLLLSTRMHEEVYDLPTLFAGVAPVMARHPDTTLVVAGDGSLRPQLERLAASLLPAGRVRFVGRLAPAELAGWLARAEVSLSASRSDSTSVSLLEAMASGAVPVVSDIEGNREWVRDGVEARLFAAGDAVSLARALEATLSDPAWRGAARRAGRAVVEARADERVNMGRIESLFESLARPEHRAMKRRVLLLAYFYPPLAGGGVHRVLSFTRHLPEAGWECTVVCAGGDDYWVRDESLLARVPAATEVLRVGGGTPLAAWLRVRGRRAPGTSARRPGGPFALARRIADWTLLPDPYVGWARRAGTVARARIAAGGIDALITTSPPDSAHLAGRTLARETHLPWVADFRDPWIGLHFLRPPTAWHAARQRAMERAVVAEADLVLAASRTHLADLHAMPARQLEFLPNGFEPMAAPTSAGADADPDPRFTIAFTGTLFRMDQTRVFLDALARWLAAEPQARTRTRVVLAGPFETGQRSHAGSLALADVVEFPGPLAHAATRALQARADLLLLWKPDGPGYRTMVPGKLYEYLDAGRPLLALLPPDDEAARMVADAGGGRVDPGDAGALATALARQYRAWSAGGTRAVVRPGWLDGHARGALARRLAGMLDALVKGHGRP